MQVTKASKQILIRDMTLNVVWTYFLIESHPFQRPLESLLFDGLVHVQVTMHFMEFIFPIHVSLQTDVKNSEISNRSFVYPRNRKARMFLFSIKHLSAVCY